MSRTKSAFLGSVSSQLFSILALVLSMVATPLILKVLNKEEYGLVSILMQVISYLTLFDFGLGAAISRSLAANRGEDDTSKTAVNKIISTSFIIYSLLGLLVMITGCLFAPYVPQVFKMAPELEDISVNILYTLSIFVGLQFPLRVFSSIFYAHQKQLMYNTIGLGITLINLGLPVILLYNGFGLWSYVYTNLVASVISITITIITIRKYYSYLKIRLSFFDQKLLSEMFHFGFFIFLNALAGQIIFYTDRFFIGSIVSLSAITMFSLTTKATEIARELIFRITDNAYPAMVEISSKEGDAKLKRIHQKLLLVTVCLTSIATWMVFILDEWFLKLWVGNGYFAGETVLILSLMLMAQYTILHVSSVCLNGAGIVKGFSLVSIVEAGLNILLTIFLGRMFGIPGILGATLIASLFTTFWFVPFTAMKFLKLSFWEYFLSPILKPVLLISSFGFLIYWLSDMMFESVTLNWLNFLAIALLLSFFFALFVWVIFLKKEFSIYLPNRFKKYLV